MKSTLVASTSVVALMLWGAARPAQGAMNLIGSSQSQATLLDKNDKDKDKDGGKHVVMDDGKCKDPQDKNPRSQTKPPKDHDHDHDGDHDDGHGDGHGHDKDGHDNNGGHDNHDKDHGK